MPTMNCRTSVESSAVCMILKNLENHSLILPGLLSSVSEPPVVLLVFAKAKAKVRDTTLRLNNVHASLEDNERVSLRSVKPRAACRLRLRCTMLCRRSLSG